MNKTLDPSSNGFKLAFGKVKPLVLKPVYLNQKSHRPKRIAALSVQLNTNNKESTGYERVR